MTSIWTYEPEGTLERNAFKEIVSVPKKRPNAIAHTKPLNTISVFVVNEHGKILTLQTNNQKPGVIGGWITRGEDRNHTLEQAMNAAMAKICQECGHGDTNKQVCEFYSQYSIDFISFFTYDKGSFAHAVFFVRWFTGDEEIIGSTKSPNRYDVSNHKFVTYEDLTSSKLQLKSATREDMNQMLFHIKIQVVL
jgi:isopentenyldiphosphate isomerase